MTEDVGARQLGEKLMGEVRTEGLGSFLKSLNDLMTIGEDTSSTASPTPFSSITELDSLLLGDFPPIIELLSSPLPHHLSGSGTTSLLYPIISHALLPAETSSTPLKGRNAAVVVIDPLNHLSISCLAQTMFHHILRKTHANAEVPTAAIKSETTNLIKHALSHLHIFRPLSFASLISTLRSLPSYLFDTTRHKSAHRQVHALIIEDLDTYIWPIRNFSFGDGGANPLATASAQLTTALVKLSGLLSCGVIITSQSKSSHSPNSSNSALHRSVFPTTWPQSIQSQLTRFILKRIEVTKFAPGLSIEEVEKERNVRWEVVNRGRFECVRVGGGCDVGSGGQGEGRTGGRFVFRVTDGGLEIERDEG